MLDKIKVVMVILVELRIWWIVVIIVVLCEISLLGNELVFNVMVGIMIKVFLFLIKVVSKIMVSRFNFELISVKIS